MFDRRHIEKGVVTESMGTEDGQEVHFLTLTKLGSKYMVGLFALSTAKKLGQHGNFKLTELPDIKDLPKNSIEDDGKILRFNSNAVNWTQQYILNNPFNEAVYKFASSMGDDIFESQPCREDPLDNPKWKRWSR